MTSRKKPQYQLKSGDRLGDWVIKGRLGKPGGNGEVYKVHHHADSSRVYALKLLHKKHGDGPQRFHREIEVLRELSEHKCPVLPLIDASPETSDTVWFVMPVAVPLAQRFEGLSPEQKLRDISQVARALAELLEHASPVNHRDIKPANLLWTKELGAVPGDLGLARHDKISMAEPLTNVQNRHLGSEKFKPDDALYATTPADWEKVDVYSLARTTWCLLAGKKTPPADLRSDKLNMVSMGESVVPSSISHMLDRLLADATNPVPGNRPSLSRFAEVLDECAKLIASPGDTDYKTTWDKRRLVVDEVLAWVIKQYTQGGAQYFEGAREDPEGPSEITHLTNKDFSDALLILKDVGEISGEPAYALGSPEVLRWPKVVPSSRVMFRSASASEYLGRVYRSLRVQHEAVIVVERAKFLLSVLAEYGPAPSTYWDLDPATPAVVGERDTGLDTNEAVLLLQELKNNYLVTWESPSTQESGSIFMNHLRLTWFGYEWVMRCGE